MNSSMKEMEMTWPSLAALAKPSCAFCGPFLLLLAALQLAGQLPGALVLLRCLRGQRPPAKHIPITQP